MKAKILKSLAVNSGYLFAAQWGSQTARLLYAFLIAYWLGPESFGQYSHGMSWYLLFLPLTVWGTDVMVSREFYRSDLGRAELIANTLGLRLLLSGAVLGLYAIYWISADLSQEAGAVLALFMLALPGRSLATWADQFFIAVQASHHSFKLHTAFRVFEVLLGSALLLSGAGILPLVVVHFASWWAHAFWGMHRLRREGVQSTLHWNASVLRKLYRNGLPFMLSGFAYTALLQVPIASFPALNGDAALLGTLSLLMQLLFLVNSVPIIMGLASLPVMSENPDGRYQRQKSYFEGLLKLGFLFSFLCGISAHLFAPWFFEQVFVDRYPQADRIAQQVFWLVGPMAWLAAAIHTIYSMKSIRVVLLGLLAGTLVMGVVFWLKVPDGGPAWSIYGMGAGTLVATLILFRELNRKLALSIRQSVVKPALAALCGAATYFSGIPVGLSYPLALAVAATLAYRLVLSPGERDLVSSYLLRQRG